MNVTKVVAVLLPECLDDESCQSLPLSVIKGLNLKGLVLSHNRDFLTVSDCNLTQPDWQDTVEVIITTPFHPLRLNSEFLSNAAKLKLCITAGVGSDHIDLVAAAKHGIDVIELTGSNVIDVAEHAILTILVLTKNFTVAHAQSEQGQWNVSKIASRTFSLCGSIVGVVGAGRIGRLVMMRLQAFGVKKILYYDPLTTLTTDEFTVCEKATGLGDMVSQCDIVTIHCPLNDKTRNLFNAELLKKCKPGCFLINTARGAICETNAVVESLKSGRLAGYGGDVWDVQPAPKTHPWRTMGFKGLSGVGNAMVPHYSGASLRAQEQIQDDCHEVLERYFKGESQRPEFCICQNGKIVSPVYQ